MERINVLAWLRDPKLMIDWLQGKMRAFFLLPGQIAALKVKAQKIKEIIQDRNPVGAAQLSSVQAQLGQIGADQTAMQSRVSTLFSRLGAIGIKMPGAGMGAYGASPYGMAAYDDYYGGLGIIPAIPLILIATGGAVALGIVGIFANYKKQERIVAAVESGALSAEEAQTLGAGRPIFALPGMGKMMLPLLAIGGFMIAQRMRR